MADDLAFQEAVEALRAGNKAKARDLFTALIKTDQGNVTYWIWLSGAMETTKERIYCLQTAFKLDPANATAKRGLIMLGALPADETIQPFALNRPRAWEERLLLAHEKPKPKGWAAVKQSPVFRLGLVILLVGGLIAGVVFGFVIPSTLRAQRAPTAVRGTAQTYTPSPTSIGAKPQATQAAGTPGGIEELLSAPYTPTALYVEVERSPLTSDYLLQYRKAVEAKKWDDAITALRNVLTAEPTATYAYYYLGDTYLQKNDPGSAIQAFNEGIQKDANFGPMYVGLARARLSADPNANVLSLLDQGIQIDPNFADAYLLRGSVKIRDNDIPGAVADLGEANNRLPNNPLVFYNLAQVYLKTRDYERALAAALKTRELDITLLPNYLLLAQIYIETDKNAEAIQTLQFYLKYAPNDVVASVTFGKLLFDMGEYEQTVTMMDRVTALERTRTEAYLYRFLANVELGKGAEADKDLDTAMKYYPDLFDANLALVRAHILNERYGSAEQALANTIALAETDEQKALIYYWAGITYEKRENAKKAIESWQLLLDLPASAMTAELRKQAEEHLAAIHTPTPSPVPSNTKPATPTKKVTPTRTPTVTQTPTK
ncbi:MAG: tetratricopeptide repeat protein [Chloroflexota bacterium]